MHSLANPDKAKELYDQALAPLREAGSKGRVAIALNNIGANYSDLKDYRKALEVLLHVLALRTEKDDPNGRAITLNNIARCYDNLGEKQKALETLHRSAPVASVSRKSAPACHDTQKHRRLSA